VRNGLGPYETLKPGEQVKLVGLSATVILHNQAPSAP
jgi:hypothetical protein